MQIYQITDSKFRKYGRILKNVTTDALLQAMEHTPLPEDVIYIPSDPALEALPVCQQFQNEVYGELPIQIGYCNGNNYLLNAVEYHRSSEINVAQKDLILLLGCQQDITEDFTYDTSKIEAFLLPAKTAVEIYATTLHYAPCNADKDGFRCVVVLPKDTNLELNTSHKTEDEDKLLTAKNKWLIAHKDSGLEGQAFIGLIGENISVK